MAKTRHRTHLPEHTGKPRGPLAPGNVMGEPTVHRLLSVVCQTLWSGSSRNEEYCHVYTISTISSLWPPQRRNVTRICEALGVPLAVKKLEGPTTVIILLEIELDTVKMEMRLPADNGK